MDNKLFDELESNLKKAVHIAKGRTSPKTIHVVVTPAQIKAIRRKTGLSQAAFARTFHLNLDTVKGWEQGKRSPDTAASNYLRMIQADPEFAQKTIAA